ncbi:hypothetical protein M378DRAFT_181643 [Amanita muscaria Koide BX008]|uniref:Uncharacterized protein n=1 Tax=Amanita muscaria (strain Koide BX008) TaxID=946122 RepID=A0A0C2WL44_AMAMK|nr:hypothetical protein M378DRAFT_181643 [Amanita muscaria Koide BX008]
MDPISEDPKAPKRKGPPSASGADTKINYEANKRLRTRSTVRQPIITKRSPFRNDSWYWSDSRELTLGSEGLPDSDWEIECAGFIYSYFMTTHTHSRKEYPWISHIQMRAERAASRDAIKNAKKANLLTKIDNGTENNDENDNGESNNGDESDDDADDEDDDALATTHAV